MSNYNSLKATIDANIKQNGNQEITGQILNSVLNQMVTTLGAGYQFAGVATLDPATDPGTPDAKVFYIANGKGTYEKFGSINVTEDEVVVLYWDSSWHKVSTGIASQAKLSELGQKVDELENGEKQVLTFLRGSTVIPCDFKQGHIYKCTFARYIPYASESPEPMKVTLMGDGVTNSYIPKENGVYLRYGDTYYYVSPNNYTSVNSYSNGTSEWDVYDITEQSEDVFRMMRDSEYVGNGDAVYDSLGIITQQNILWSNGCSGIITRSNFNNTVFEYETVQVTCVNAIGTLSYRVTYSYNYDNYGNIVNVNITIAKI